ncbi:amidohydrolase [Zafaria sp. J156]|uniref:amidohydrolase n=1 Tax=Zafaria sp. J156 TaxID=3116490 RepID=UPI002E7696CB|nr:amidohydrolase [Zafaria sp. J156]MEE1622404.1 amidohydrolase [Zafaria sp. J156]
MTLNETAPAPAGALDATHVEALAERVAVAAPEFTAMADAIWDDPEMRWEEFRAQEKHQAAARAHGFTVTERVGGIPTAFSAERGSGGPVIAFLGEYDALADISQESGNAERTPDPANASGNGHGCHHHLLGSGALMAAVVTAEYFEAAGIEARVRYYGCPAEEAAAGKTFMVKSGAFADVDAAVTWHPTPLTRSRQSLTLSYSQVYFHFTGLAAHAGAMPHLGRSALDAVELMNVGVNFLREHMPDSARVHYAITDAGGRSPNVVQAHASVYYVIRAEDTRQMRELHERVVRIARGAALMTETELEIEFDGACAEVLPNEVLERTLEGVLRQIGPVPFDAEDQQTAARFAAGLDAREISGAKRLVGWQVTDGRALHDGIAPFLPEQPRPQMTGSTDVGDVSWVVPTVQISSATAALGTPFHAWQTVAQGKLPAAHKGMLHAATSMAATAAAIVLDPGVLAAARQEHRDVLAVTPYLEPIPDGVVAPPLRAGARSAGPGSVS